MDQARVLQQIDSLLDEVGRARRASPHDDLSGGLPSDEIRQIHTRLRAAIDRLSAPGSRYAAEAEAAVRAGWVGEQIVHLGGVLQALRADVEAGYVQTFEELIHGAVFEDFLEMASELLAKGYKDAAAVIAGTVIEEHTRSLSVKNAIAQTRGKRTRSVDELLIDLVKVQQLSETQRKIAAGWYGIRNDAAHSNYASVVAEDVGRMIDGIRDFMNRFPA